MVMMACYHNSIRVHSYLPCAALVPPSLSPWHELYNEGDPFSFLHVTGLTQEAFDRLLFVVIPCGHPLCRQRKGRPWSLPPDGMLGLMLCYLGSQMTIKWLCLIFGITPSPCSRMLKNELWNAILAKKRKKTAKNELRQAPNTSPGFSVSLTLYSQLS